MPLTYPIVREKMNLLAKRISNAIECFRLNERPFVIISNNCWGYELYNALGRKYNTPFVGLFLFPECYIQFLENFETCINSEMKFSTGSKYMSTNPNYPIGLLCGHIEIHFLHYTSEDEAISKWNRRIRRLKKAIEANEPFFVKFCDRDGCEKDHIERFHSTFFQNKISIGINKFEALNHLYQPRLKDPQGGSVMNGLKLYRKRYHYFDISDWIINKRVYQSLFSRILSLIS